MAQSGGSKKAEELAVATSRQHEGTSNAASARGLYDGQDTGVFDAETKASLKAYQKLRHLKANGFYTGKTARSLNVPCKRRYETLVLNAKRWRHTALTNEDFYIFVNLAGFKASYVVDGELHTERRVVVGAGRSFWSPSEKRRIYKIVRRFSRIA